MIEYINKNNELKEIDLESEAPFNEFVEDLKSIGIIECNKVLEQSHQNDDEILLILKEIVKKSKTYKEELDKLRNIYNEKL